MLIVVLSAVLKGFVITQVLASDPSCLEIIATEVKSASFYVAPIITDATLMPSASMRNHLTQLLLLPLFSATCSQLLSALS